MFGLLYPFRFGMIKKYNLDKSFDFSMSWLFFHDKYEKLCTGFQLAADNAHLELHERCNRQLFCMHTDGGFYDSIYNIVDKYGLVPRAAYGESPHTKHTKDLNSVLERLVALYIRQIRAASPDERPAVISKAKVDARRLLCLMLGEPPCTVEFMYREQSHKAKNREGRYSRFTRRTLHCKTVTPLEFRDMVYGANKYRGRRYGIINDTDPNRNYDTLYTGFHGRRNVYDAPPRRYLNTNMSDILRYIRISIRHGIPVPIECDITVGNHYGGFLIKDLHRYDLLLPGLDEALPKHEELRYGLSSNEHICCVVGYNSENGLWKIANSWGTDSGKSGYWLAESAWMDRYVYAAYVQPDILSERHRAIADGPPSGSYGVHDDWY